MSQHHAILIDELWNETERLQARVAELQSQLAQSQPAQSQIAQPVEEPCDDVWNVWPYSWAQSGWSFTRIFFADRFHSLHENHLARRNRRVQRAFWQTPHPEDIELKVI